MDFGGCPGSPAVSVPVAAGAPSQPSLDEITEDSLSVSWDKPSDDGGGKLLGYDVEVKESPDGPWTVVNDAPIKDTRFKIPHLRKGSEYQVRVKAVNAAGQGAPSKPTRNVTVEKQPGTHQTRTQGSATAH